MKYVIHQKHHYGWTKDEFDAKNIDDAVEQSVRKYHNFLEEYEGKFRIEHTIGTDEFPRYRVFWTSNTPKDMFGGGLHKGDYWFAERIEVGEKDDCPDCGGTGMNFYYSWRECYECGDGKTDGKSSGKILMEENTDENA